MTPETKTDLVKLNRETIVKLIRKWGNVASDGLLEEDCQIFSIPEIEGFIGYKVESQNAVVLGDPVCSPGNSPELAKAFDAECQKMNLKTVYAVVSQEFADWASQNLSASVIEYGKVIVLDPQNNPTKSTGHNATLVRKKVKRALNEGVVVKEYHGGDLQKEKQMIEVGQEWLRTRTGPQVYLAHLSLFDDREGKRWFYAVKDDRIVGFLTLNEVQSQKGWVFGTTMMIKDSPKGLSELLVITILEVLQEEGSQVVLAGPVPSKQLGHISGVGEIKSAMVRVIYRIARHIFHLEGREAFWAKFQPQQRGSFLLFPHHNLRLSSIKALMQAFNVEKGKM